MDRETGRLIVATLLRSGRVFTDLIPTLQERLSEPEYKIYLRRIGAYLAEGAEQLLNPVFAEFPGLKEEMDAQIQASGSVD